MRYAQRQLSFALEETDSKDSRAMILMLKLMETVLANINTKISGIERRAEQIEAAVEGQRAVRPPAASCPSARAGAGGGGQDDDRPVTGEVQVWACKMYGVLIGRRRLRI